jgi:hypothetical protein
MHVYVIITKSRNPMCRFPAKAATVSSAWRGSLNDGSVANFHTFACLHVPPSPLPSESSFLHISCSAFICSYTSALEPSLIEVETRNLIDFQLLGSANLAPKSTQSIASSERALGSSTVSYVWDLA